MTRPWDVGVIGGGIIGLATAQACLSRWPRLRVLLIEKEPQLATHQTGHNSGVIHSGIYYRPGTLKARLCVAGAQRLRAFCDGHEIPYRPCGKVIVATTPEELPRLEELYARGLANGVPGVARLGPEPLREREPRARGVAAVHLPQVAVVDFRRVAVTLGQLVTQAGGTVLTSTRVLELHAHSGGWVIETTRGTQHAGFLINCGGLHADRLARLAGERADVRLIPFRGEYYDVVSSRRDLVQGLVYPVPDPALPFLGVHFTKTLDGGVHVGPNAVLALQREGYARGAVSWRDCWELLANPGFWRMSRRHWRAGLSELQRSWSTTAFLRAAQRLVPSLTAADLRPSPAGVRAQAVARDGSLLDDFVLRDGPQALHVYNAPSPAATASLSIGECIAERLAGRLGRTLTGAALESRL